MKLLSNIYYKALNTFENYKENKRISNSIRDFLKYYAHSEEDEIQSLLKFYNSGRKHPFPYFELDRYKTVNVFVNYDNIKKLKYVNHNGKKLFFPNSFDESRIIKLYRGMCCELDEKSPHCYTQNNFLVNKDTVLLDIGCAEATFSLNHVDTVDRIILFESNPNWIAALTATFEPWKNKVTIINKLVSDESSNDTVNVDSIIDQIPSEKNIFLKIDVEGWELKVLDGSKKVLNSFESIKIAIATYHNQDDYDIFDNILSGEQFSCKNTDGYILFYYDINIKPPYLRRCLMQAQKLN
jgi:hypothetical protein